jgi:enamine deaminase RidA (YjgF/YER057c/UK114 family)
MDYERIEYPDLSVEADTSIFSLPGGIPEYHAMIRLTDPSLSAGEQYGRIETAAERLQARWPDAPAVWKRYFASDAVNQYPFLGHGGGDTAVSVVQQPPLNGTKVAVWIYFVPAARLSYRHMYHTQLHSASGDETAQTDGLFRRYIHMLAAQECTLEKHCIRTWVYVQGVDTHYAGMVAARKACFEREGLSPETHFIASTGIEGKYIRPETLVFMDAYAVCGLQPGQVRHLHAPTHLNPTHEYGVTFERGTAVQYGDRRHIFISGTASINNRGEIEHPMDIVKQTGRMFENIRALLDEAGSGMDEVASLIVYLRDMADYRIIDDYMRRAFPRLPGVIVWAPVCRPGWLIEAECVAIKAAGDSRFAVF